MRIRGHSIIFLALIGCVIDAPQDYRSLPPEDDVALLHSAQYISHSSSELVFDAQIIVLNSFYQGFDNDYLNEQNFGPQGNGTYTIESFNGQRAGPPGKASSIIFLIDQSGNYENIDPYNSRSQAINKFFQDVHQPNNFLMGACARQGALTTEPLELLTTEFGNDWQANSAYLFGLSHRTGGLSAIWDAADQAVELLMANTESVRKELVLLVHGNDENSATSLENLILKAQDHGIRIHVIALGTETDTFLFAQLSQQTGGLFAACSTDKQMVKVFSELERLINGELYVYKMRIRFKPSQEGILNPGSGSMHRFQINDNYIDKVYNSVDIQITIPS